MSYNDDVSTYAISLFRCAASHAIGGIPTYNEKERDNAPALAYPMDGAIIFSGSHFFSSACAAPIRHFIPAGAEAFQRDIPNTVVRLLPTGHFALETHLEEIVIAVREFLAEHVTNRSQ